MKLSNKAINELKEALRYDIGNAVNKLSKDDLNQLGNLTVMVNSLKIRSRNNKL